MSEAERRIVEAFENCIKCNEYGELVDDCTNCPRRDEAWVKRGRCACEDYCDMSVSIPLKLAQDVLALLQEREPHVLTLQECYEAPFVWLEEADGIVKPVVRKVRPIVIEPGMLTISRFDGPMRIDRERYYGKTFRCWDQYPSDKYRKAAKWG